MPDLTPQEPDRVQQNSSKTPQGYAAAIRAELDRLVGLAGDAAWGTDGDDDPAIADDRQRVERDLATLDDHQWDGGMCGRCMWGKNPCPDTSRALASLRGLYEALGLTDA